MSSIGSLNAMGIWVSVKSYIHSPKKLEANCMSLQTCIYVTTYSQKIPDYPASFSGTKPTSTQETSNGPIIRPLPSCVFSETLLQPHLVNCTKCFLIKTIRELRVIPSIYIRPSSPLKREAIAFCTSLYNFT